MRIIVLAKQVPEPDKIKIDRNSGTIGRVGVPSMLNPDDANAMEAALELKDNYPDTTVSVVSMGPKQAMSTLRECLAMGADDAYLISSPAFGGADTCATSKTLAAAVKKLGDFDFIFAGRQSTDGDTAQVGPQTAQRLGVPSVTYVQKIREIKQDTIIVERALEDGYEVIEVEKPCLMTVIKELNTPRYMSVIKIEDAYNEDITVWNEHSLRIDPKNAGIKASPTQVLRVFIPPPKGAGEMLSGSVPEMAAELVAKLTDKHIL